MTSEHQAPPAVVADLVRSYTDQFTTTVETLRRRGQHLAAQAPKDGDSLKALVHSDIEPILKEKQAYFTEVATDFSDLPETTKSLPETPTYKFLLETYGWAAICLFGAGLGSIVGGYFLSPLIEMVLSNFMAVVLAYVALPYYFLVYVRRLAEPTVTLADMRMTLFYVAVAMGVLNGHNLALCYSASFSPPSFITPLVIAVVAEFAGTKLAPSRMPMVGACVGSAVAVHLVLGIASGSLDIGYALSTIMQGAIAFAGLQYTLSAIKDGSCAMIELQLLHVTSAIVLGAIGAYLTGMTKEQAEAVAAAYQEE